MMEWSDAKLSHPPFSLLPLDAPRYRALMAAAFPRLQTLDDITVVSSTHAHNETSNLSGIGDAGTALPSTSRQSPTRPASELDVSETGHPRLNVDFIPSLAHNVSDTTPRGQGRQEAAAAADAAATSGTFLGARGDDTEANALERSVALLQQAVSERDEAIARLAARCRDAEEALAAAGVRSHAASRDRRGSVWQAAAEEDISPAAEVHGGKPPQQSSPSISEEKPVSDTGADSAERLNVAEEAGQAGGSLAAAMEREALRASVADMQLAFAQVQELVQVREEGWRTCGSVTLGPLIVPGAPAPA